MGYGVYCPVAFYAAVQQHGCCTAVPHRYQRHAMRKRTSYASKVSGMQVYTTQATTSPYGPVRYGPQVLCLLRHD